MNSPKKGNRPASGSGFAKTANPNPDPQVEQAKMKLTGDDDNRRVQTTLTPPPAKHDPNTIYCAETVSIERKTDKAGAEIVVVNFVNPQVHPALNLYEANDFDMEQLKVVGINLETIQKQTFYPVLWNVEYRWVASPFGQKQSLVSIKVAQPVTPISDWVKDPEKVEAFKKQAKSMVKRGEIGLFADGYVEKFIFETFGFQSWDDVIKLEHNFQTEIYRLGEAIDKRRKQIMTDNDTPTWPKTHGAKYFPETAATMTRHGIPQEQFETVREEFLQHEFKIDSHTKIPTDKTYDDVIGRFNGWLDAVYLNREWNPDKVKLMIANRLKELGISRDDPRMKQIFTGFLTAYETESLDQLKERRWTRDQTMDSFSEYLKGLPQGEIEPTPENKPPLQFPVHPQTLPSENEKVVPLFKQITTLMGVPVCDIAVYMNARFPDAAYEAIPNGPMKGKTDLGFEYVRNRFDEVFGTYSYGWKLEPHPILGAVLDKAETKSTRGEKPYEYTDYVVTLLCHVLKYRVVMPDGSIQWEECSPLSDSDSNTDRGYAYRGALTSLLKQFLRMLGGLNHIYFGEYTHVEAEKNSSAKPKNPPRSKAG